MGLDLKKSKIKPTSKLIKLELLAHCSCGKDYKIKEKFVYLGKIVRSTECPKCYRTELIAHNLVMKGTAYIHDILYEGKVIRL